MGFHTRLVWALGMGRGDVLEVSASTAFDDRIVTDCASGHENRNGAWRRELRHPVRPVKTVRSSGLSRPGPTGLP